MRVVDIYRDFMRGIVLRGCKVVIGWTEGWDGWGGGIYIWVFVLGRFIFFVVICGYGRVFEVVGIDLYYFYSEFVGIEGDIREKKRKLRGVVN